MWIEINDVDVDDPDAVMSYIWDGAPADAQYRPEEVVDVIVYSSAIVTSDGMRVSVGFDPNEDGILWSIDGDTFGDGTQFDPLHFGGWALGDRETAKFEIAGIITTINGGTVAEWQPSPEEAKTYLAVLPEVGGIEIQHDGEDIDIVWTSDGIRPGVVEFEESERWEPHVYTAALLAAGWEIVSDWVLDDGIERVHTAVVRPKKRNRPDMA